MKIKIVLLHITCLLYGHALLAQEVTGIARDERDNPVGQAVVTLRKSTDSSIVKINGTDQLGHYQFKPVPTGRYWVQVTHIGYKPANSSFFVVGDTSVKELPAAILKKLSGNLKEVVVTSARPLIEVKADRIVMNVEGTINAIGQNVLELLKKSPGVIVDKDGGLSMSGRNGVQVFIDGKPSPLTDKDLADYLASLQSAGVGAIDIIANPSSRYEAAGNGGIINIRLKKNKAYGTNGMVTAGFNIGHYPKYLGGLSLNHRGEKTNLFLNYNYSGGQFASYVDQYRLLLDTSFNQRSVNNSHNQRHNIKAGMDYFINNRNTLGMMINSSFSGNTLYANSNNIISNTVTNEVNKLLVANNSSKGRRDNTTVNLNYHYTDTLGHDLSIDGDYGAYKIRGNQMQPNEYYDPSGKNLLYSYVYNMISPTDIDIYSVKLDYEQNAMKGKLGIGAKSSFVTSYNDFQQYNIFGSNSIQDTLRSNDFRYKENINALYLNYSRSFKHFSFQAGLRAENTNSTGTSAGYKLQDSKYVNYDSTFNRHYTDLFPSAGFTFNPSPVQQWSINYSRRIDRPAYRDLNPFEFKIDDYTFRKGNTELQPQYTNSIGITHMYKQRLTTTLNYSHVKDVFTVLTDTTDKSKTFITKRNLAFQDIVSLNISYPFQYKWYSFFGNINAFYTIYNANFGPGRDIDLRMFTVNAYIQQTFDLGKGWTGELTGFYTSPAIIQGTFKNKEVWSVDAGIRKVVMKNKGIVQVSVSDIFNTSYYRATSIFSGQTVITKNREESRQLKLNFSYRFGNSRIKPLRQHKGGAEDEGKRSNL